MSKNLSSMYERKLLDTPKKSETVAFKTASETAIQNTAEATGDLVGKYDC